MQKSPSSAHKSSFGVQDVIFVLFKHKWMILLFSIIGLGAAAALFMAQKPIFASQAKLLVRYVLVRGTVDPFNSQASPGGAGGMGGDPVINTELEILTSVDLAMMVAEAVGVDKLVPQAAGHAKLSDAAGVILANLKVGVGQSANVVLLEYSNEDPETSKVVLNELVKCYFNKHLEIHRSAANFDLVAKQTEEVRERLAKTEAELNKMRTESGIVTLADATGALTTQKSKLQEELMAAKAEFAEQQASMESRKQDTAAEEASAAANTSDASTTPAAVKKEAPVPPQIVAEYRTAVEMLAFLRKREMELRVKFTAGNRLVALNRAQIDDYDARLSALLKRYPRLEEEAEEVEQQARGTKPTLVMEKARLAAISAKIAFYESNLKVLSEQFSEQYAIGAKIEELDRRKQMEEAEYRSLETNLKNAKIDQTLDPGRMPNITVVQHPSEPSISFDEKMKKVILGLAGGGIALGLGLAFLIELLLDRRVKRPIEIQARLQLPLLLSIPFIRRKERGGLLLANNSNQPRIGMGDESLIAREVGEEVVENTPRKTGHFILPYSETIRDRIIFNFEINNITHKPKLVAVTGLSEGAGASTVAAGLAKSFSEIPGVKVLLVDLSSYHPEDSPLFGEIPRHSLNGALHLARNTQFRENPQNLYYASANARRDDTGLTTFSPVHLYELMPHLQASQYDYIVFDMPTVDQTSRTLTMAGLMDKVLLVLDAENTSRDSLMWGYSELVKGRADVSCVFNKMRSPVPGWLSGGEN